MTQYNSLNVNFSNSQLNKLKSAIKNKTEVLLRSTSNMIGNSDDETNFCHKLLLTNRQVANLPKAFPNYLSADIKLSETQLSKIKQSDRFLGRILGPSLKTGLPLIKNVLQLLAKSVLIPLVSIATASAADAGIHKKILGLETTALIISNKEKEDILKKVKSLEDSGLLIKSVSETIQNEAKEQKDGFLCTLLGTIGASLLENMLTKKEASTTGDGTIRAGYGSKGSLKNKDF